MSQITRAVELGAYSLLNAQHKVGTMFVSLTVIPAECRTGRPARD